MPGKKTDNSSPPRMKLYIWNNVLRDYTSGVMFAMATSVKEARALLREHFPKGTTGYADCAEKPEVCTSPTAWYCWGGG